MRLQRGPDLLRFRLQLRILPIPHDDDLHPRFVERIEPAQYFSAVELHYRPRIDQQHFWSRRAAGAKQFRLMLVQIADFGRI